ncbi:MAG: protein kinase domain-containing protein [Planctomycetota bacterium]|jgi:serine/threonine protein kinase
MLKKGDIVERMWKVDRLLLDDGLASYFETFPVGPEAPSPPPMLLLRAVESSAVGDVFPQWPIRSPEIERDGIPERVVIGEEEGRVLVDIFDVAPGLPVYEEGKCLPAQTALECLLDACTLVDAFHKERWFCRTLNPFSFFRAGSATGLWMYPQVSMERFDQPLKATLGMPGYIAPEAWKPAKAAPRMDIYALGAIAYAWLSGEHPFAEVESIEEIQRLAGSASLPDISSRENDVPAAASAMVRKCTSPHPMDRPRFVSDVARLARDILTELARSAREAPEPAKPAALPGPDEAPPKAKSRGTQILPFSLDDIIEETEGQS